MYTDTSQPTFGTLPTGTFGSMPALPASNDPAAWQTYLQSYQDYISSLTGFGNVTQNNTNTNTSVDNNTNGNITIPEAGADLQVVPGLADPNQPGQMNVVDYSGQVVANPSNFFTLDNPDTTNLNESMFAQDHQQIMNPLDPNTNIDPNQNKYQMDASQYNAQAAQGQANTAAQVQQQQAANYNAYRSFYDMMNAMMQGATGALSQGAQIDPSVVEANVSAISNNPALNDSAYQSITNIIDTSTSAGKILADQLGQFGYVDSKATLKGQLELLQQEFVGPNGEPKIPSWAAANAREVSKMMAFKGISGTAATAAMSQAILEASLPIAQADSQFFQTVTLQNLNNKQESIINKANIISKLELANMDNRMAAAVQNSKNFLEMDMANLDNDQQARVINTQARVQSILDDANAENAARLFGAQSENDFNKFYSELSSSINQFNAAQRNSMEQFNTNETNSMREFNAEMENNRDQFYKNMQYNIDLSNARWRQELTLQDDEQQFEAASLDVRNMVGVSLEQLNQIWDRSDSLLDYIWKSSENELDRKNALAIQTLVGNQAALNQASALAAQDKAGFGSILGTIAGSLLGSDKFISGLTDFIF